MSHHAVLLMLLGMSLSLIAAGWWLLGTLARQDIRDRRIAAIRQGVAPPKRSSVGAAESLPVRLVAGIGTLLARSGLLPAKTRAELEQTLASSGLRQRNAFALFIGGKLLLCLLVPCATFVLLHSVELRPGLRPIGVGMAAIAGLLLPDLIVRRKRSAYLAAVARGLPDALDMLVICSEAGLGLEAGLERVAAEIEPANREIATELKLTSGELRILADRRIALTNMGTRTGLETLKRLGATLVQTLQYGTPLSQALRTLAAEMRYEMLMRFEAQAARLPVLLTVPMILFILPCIFIVVGGPAGLTVARTFIHH